MSLNTVDLMTSFRESYHDSTRKNIVSIRNQKKRNFNSLTLHKTIHANISSETQFSQQSFQILLSMLSENTNHVFLMLANYMCSYIVDTSYTVFQTIKNMPCYDNQYFAQVVRLSLQSQNSNPLEVSHHIDQFLESDNDETFKYGLNCVIHLLEKGCFQVVINLENLKNAIDLSLKNADLQISSYATQILFILLTNNLTRCRIFCFKTIQQLIYLINKNKKLRERTLELLTLLYSDFDLHLEDQKLLKQLIIIYYSQQGHLLSLISDVWITIFKYQTMSFVLKSINAGLKNIICMKLTSSDVNVIYKSLQVLSMLYQILCMSGEDVILKKVMNYFENNFSLQKLLQKLHDHNNEKVRNLSFTIYQTYYSDQQIQDLQ